MKIRIPAYYGLARIMESVIQLPDQTPIGKNATPSEKH